MNDIDAAENEARKINNMIFLWMNYESQMNRKDLETVSLKCLPLW